MGAIEKFDTLDELLKKYPKKDLGKSEDLTKLNINNNLIPLCIVDKKIGYHAQWACQCKICKKFKVVKSSKVKDEGFPGCCGNVKNLINKRFGNLIVLQKTNKTRGRSVIWKCKCDCGKECYVCSKELLNGDTQSCGCLKYKTSHGEMKINKILQENKISFHSQYQIKINNTYRYIDFTILDKNSKILYGIEYDGKQHFNEKDGWEPLEKTQQRDKEKNLWFKNNNIPLIRIPYTHYNDLCIEDLMLETSKFLVE